MHDTRRRLKKFIKQPASLSDKATHDAGSKSQSAGQPGRVRTTHDAGVPSVGFADLALLEMPARLPILEFH